MYPKVFFERFWEGEQRNELFVCMPFHDSFDGKFDVIMEAAQAAGLEKAVRVKEDWQANVITDKIFDGIANSRLLLFDLSNDPKHKQVNGNVLYELGIANAMREPQDMVLIREKSRTKVPFDITGLTYITHVDLSTDKLREIIKNALEKQEWHQSKRVQAASQSLDELALTLMYNSGRNPDGANHFGLEGKAPEIKLSVLRLIDLGMLRFAWGCYKDAFESAYYWTRFGYEVMKHLGIKRLTDEEFKALPEYEEHLRSLEKYKNFKKQLNRETEGSALDI